MALILSNGSVFLHNPRTGGGFATAVLRKCGVVREGLGAKHDCPGVLPMDMTVPHYVFVREPYAWIRSVYAIQADWGWPTYPKHESRWWHPFREINDPPLVAKQHFTAFLAWMMTEHPGWVTRLFTKFADWPNSVVLRTEEMTAALERVVREAGGDPRRVAQVGPTVKAKERHHFTLPADPLPVLIREWKQSEAIAYRRFGYEEA